MAKNSSPLLFLPLVLFPLIILIQSTNSQTHPNDVAALQQIKNSLIDIPSSSSTPHFFSSWNFSSDPCSSFAGVTCTFTRVTTLTLSTGLSDSPGLAGTLSPSITNLTYLTQLILFSGIVTGPIPSNLDSLQYLKVISLTNNRLTGPIPTSIFTLPNLHTLDLSHNQISGTLPPTSTTLYNLKVLVLSSNKISGYLPVLLPDNLLHLDLSSNYLTGNLPYQMPLTIRYMSLSNNQMWGPLNTCGLDTLSELEYLDLSMNRFSGPIPWSIFQHPITSLFLQRNNLSGEIPQSPLLQEYTSGTTVDLSHNSLTGELTAALTGVETLFLNNNFLTGNVPEEYVESVKVGAMKTLYLQHNYITGFPVDVGSALPDTAAVCVSYNCMALPRIGMSACPVRAGDQASRPAHQCNKFRNSSISNSND